jgi:hypothetical protein
MINLNEKELYNHIIKLIKSSRKDAETEKEFIANIIFNKNAGTYDSINFFKVFILRVKLNGKKQYISLNGKAKDILNEYTDFKIESTTSDAEWDRIIFTEGDIIEKYDELFLNIYAKALELAKEEAFGCCHRYVECSDLKKCIHPDQQHARGCMYKKNLDEGHIFYGVNRNIA